MLNAESNEMDTDPTDEEGGNDFEQAPPGVLRGRVGMTLHTIWAVQVFKGRRGEKGVSQIPGLNLFSEDLGTIAEGSRQSDPYAAWFKARVDEGLSGAEAVLEAKHDELTAAIDGIQGFNIEMAFALQPQEFELTYRYPLANKAARLIALLDRVLILSSTLHHMGVIEKSETQQLAGKLKHEVRHAFNIAREYRVTGLSIEDVRNQTPKAVEISESIGVLPADFLEDMIGSPEEANTHQEPSGIESAVLNKLPVEAQEELMALHSAN